MILDLNSQLDQQPADLNLHCFHNRIHPGSAWYNKGITGLII